MVMGEDFLTYISKYELHELEAETLPVPVEILSHTSTLDEVEQSCARLIEESSHKVLGFDTETKPSFTKGITNQVSLLQLASPQHVVLVRLFPKLDKELLGPINKLLKSKRIGKVGVAIQDDAKGLWSAYRLETNHFLDLRALAKEAGVEVSSLTKLYAVLYGKRLSKGQRLSDWERPELSDVQVEYAALDAYAGLRIFEGFRNYFSRDMYQNLEVPKTRQRKKKNEVL